MTCRARREFFVLKVAVLSIFKYNPDKINLLLLNNFYPVITYRRAWKESDELLYTVWSLVTVRSQFLAQVQLQPVVVVIASLVTFNYTG